MCCLAGCAHVSTSQKQVYARGYRDGVKEQVRAIAGQFQGGNFPYYHWTSPIVQEVRVPGHIANGVFIPEHKEPVIIKPGEWAESPAYPIQSKEESYEHTMQDMAVIDITHLPNGTSTATDARPEGKDEHPAPGMETQ
ncbi:MAG: hypothetical protein HY591_04760 [Candidatus Omnitrophica bacterium]|nr:hypothetical protein [Candidatus Omnitrophota bacterium]